MSDDLIWRLKNARNHPMPSVLLIREAANALEAAQQRIAELEQRIRKMRPYNGQFMSVQEHDEICDAQYLTGLRDARDSVLLNPRLPADTVIQALIDAATAQQPEQPPAQPTPPPPEPSPR